MLKLFRFTAAVLVTATISFASTSLAAHAGSTTQLEGAGAKVVVYNINYDGQKFLGQILNRTNKTLKFVRLYYKLLNAQGQMIDAGRVWISEDELRGSGNGTFKLSVNQVIGATNMIITSAEWSDD